MKTDFKLDNNAISITDVIKNTPPEHQSMVRALIMKMNALGSPRRGDEKKKDENLRVGFMLGMIATISIASPIKNVDKFSRNSYLVEALLKLALSESHMVAWAKATQQIIIDNEPEPKPKVKIMRMDKGDKKYTSASIDDLPDEVKAAIQEMLDKSCES